MVCCNTHADPLRVLRAVRFASRYRFTMVDELKAAASLDEVCVLGKYIMPLMAIAVKKKGSWLSLHCHSLWLTVLPGSTLVLSGFVLPLVQYLSLNSAHGTRAYDSTHSLAAPRHAGQHLLAQEQRHAVCWQ